jgi:hypothetical protein
VFLLSEKISSRSALGFQTFLDAQSFNCLMAR